GGPRLSSIFQPRILGRRMTLSLLRLGALTNSLQGIGVRFQSWFPVDEVDAVSKWHCGGLVNHWAHRPLPRLDFENNSGPPQGLAGASTATSACGKLAQRVPEGSPWSTRQGAN